MRGKISSALCALASFFWFASTHAGERPWILNNNTHYLALGDSLTAGYGAIPVTEGYVYLLYRQQVFDLLTNISFANSAMPGATSDDLLKEIDIVKSAGFLDAPAPPSLLTRPEELQSRSVVTT